MFRKPTPSHHPHEKRTHPAHIGVQPVDHWLVFLACVALPKKTRSVSIFGITIIKIPEHPGELLLNVLLLGFDSCKVCRRRRVRRRGNWSQSPLHVVVRHELVHLKHGQCQQRKKDKRQLFQSLTCITTTHLFTSVAAGRNSAQLNPESLQAAATVL